MFGWGNEEEKASCVFLEEEAFWGGTVKMGSEVGSRRKKEYAHLIKHLVFFFYMFLYLLHIKLHCM